MSNLERDLNLFEAHIHTVNYRNLRRLDWTFVALTLVLAIIGVCTLYSASQSASGDFPLYKKFYFKQGAFLGLGIALALLIACVDYRALLTMAPGMYALAIVLLVAVPLIGTTAMGGQHWLRIGEWGLQPSELSKIALIYMLSWYLSRVQGKLHRLLYFLLAFVITGVLLLLILIQGDLGTALVVAPIVFVMLFAAGCRRLHLIFVIAVGLIAAPVLYFNLDNLPLKDHQRTRVVSFFNPEADPEYATNTGYQIEQTKIAVGSGQMWGKGFGKGTQTHMRFLPVYHTDFIFALYAEEMGFIGGAILIGLYGLFLMRGLALARDCPDLAGSLLVVGSLSIVAFHVLVNIAITLNLLPVTGLPLPFLSYGGSFYLTTMMCVGTILSVHVRKGFFA
jgi:rod shape determining protein RodA